MPTAGVSFIRVGVASSFPFLFETSWLTYSSSSFSLRSSHQPTDRRSPPLVLRRSWTCLRGGEALAVGSLHRCRSCFPGHRLVSLFLPPYVSLTNADSISILLGLSGRAAELCSFSSSRSALSLSLSIADFSFSSSFSSRHAADSRTFWST